MQVTQAYSRPSTARADNKGMHFDLAGELSRSPVSLHAMVKNSLSYARLMLALRKVVTGNWRGEQKDHTKYQEWVYQQYLLELPKHYAVILKEKKHLLDEKEKLNEQVEAINKEIKPLQKRYYAARSTYYNWLYKNDRSKWIILDPVISVHPDCVIFEAFSLDESTYGRISVPMSNLEIFDEISYGTTNIDFSQGLADEIYRVRSYRPAWLKVAYDQVELSTSSGGTVEKKIDLPESWVRGFLQVQSAASMPGTNVQLSTETLGNILSVLNQHKAKVSPRSLRFYLKKGEKPRIVIDPWNIEVKEFNYVYEGDLEGEVRIWGRRRLSVFTDVLPHADEVHVKLLGTGMPSYWSLSMDGHRFDVGLSGWTANDWAQKANFDLLASVGDSSKQDLKTVKNYLIKELAGTPATIAQAIGIEQKAATASLQALCQNGQAMYDPLTDIYRWRQLLQKNIKLPKAKEDDRSKYAVALLKAKKVEIIDQGEKDDVKYFHAEIQGKNLFKTKVNLDEDGRVKRAECTCSFFRKNKLRQGPCQHIIATTLAIAQAKNS